MVTQISWNPHLERFRQPSAYLNFICLNLLYCRGIAQFCSGIYKFFLEEKVILAPVKMSFFGVEGGSSNLEDRTAFGLQIQVLDPYFNAREQQCRYHPLRQPMRSLVTHHLLCSTTEQEKILVAAMLFTNPLPSSLAQKSGQNEQASWAFPPETNV